MKISCDIIEDLIPLYLEDMVSEDTRKFIDEHLDECPEQKAYVESVRKNKNIVIEKNIEQRQKENVLGPMKKIRIGLISLIAKIIVLTLAIVNLYALLQPTGVYKKNYFENSYEQVKPKIEIVNGDYLLKSDKEITGNSMSITASEGGHTSVVIISIDTRKNNDIKNKTFSKEINLTEENSLVYGEDLGAIYYKDYYNNKIVRIFGDAKYDEYIGKNWTPNFYSNLIKYIALAIVISITFAFIIRKNKNLNLISSLVSLWFSSYMIIILLSKFSLFNFREMNELNYTRETILGLDKVFFKETMLTATMLFLIIAMSYLIYRQLKKK